MTGEAPGGPAQAWDPAAYRTDAAYVPALAGPLLARLAARPGERVLDLGCGDGTLTARLAAAGARVVGVDADPAMVEAARAAGIDARLMDAARLDLPERFDAVVSNAALHWVPDHAAVARGVVAHLRPGGRFVAELGGFGNIAAVRCALHAVLARHGVNTAACDPWTFPTPAAFAAVLTAAGLTVEGAVLVPRPTPLPAGLGRWLALFAGPFLDALPASARAAAVAETEALLAPMLRDEAGGWQADYVRLRVAAHRAG